MNISASVHCPQHFGREYQLEDAQKVLDLSRQFNDSSSCKFDENKKSKDKLETAVSVAGAFASIYLTGMLMSKILTKFGGKLQPIIRKGANFVKDNASKLSEVENKKISSIAKNVAKAEDAARKTFVKIRDKEGIQKLFAKSCGIASVALAAPKVMTADGNKDGVADIAQKNINAYSSAVKNIGVVSEIVETLV